MQQGATRSAVVFGERGYAMAALLVAMSVMGVLLSVALPAWRTAVKREKEAELMFRGQQYAHAVALFQRKFAGAFPPNVDMLVDQKFLRKKYKDPITGDDFQIVPVGAAGTPTPGAPAPQGTAPQAGRAGQPAAPAQQPGARVGGAPAAGMLGVVSKSTDTSLRLYNGRNHYNEWVFVATQATTAAGAPAGTGAPTPGGVGGLPGRGTGPQDGRGQRGQGGQRGIEGQPGAPPFGGRPGFPPSGGQQQPPFQFPGRGRL